MEPNLIKKDIVTDKTILRQKRMLIVAIVGVITLFISSSYALLTNFDKTDNVISFQTGNLEMTVTNSNSSLTLTELNGKLPENDTNGLNNATPITLTLTNTGTMFIGGYEVKLVSDKNQTSTLKDEYIKYPISEDGTEYSTPSILTTNNNIVFSGYDLEVDASKTLYLKIWIDESAGNNALNKTYYGSIEVKLYQKKEKPVYLADTLKTAITSKTNSYTEDTDGIIYISGKKDDYNAATTDDIDFNYVWYSGKLWRITAIYPDGRLKMITQNMITSIPYGSNVNFLNGSKENASYVYQWLNEDFLDSLYNYEEIIVSNGEWNASPGNGTITTKLPISADSEVMVSAYVGLLDSYEYYKSYEKASSGYSNGFLNIGYKWWLLNPYNTSASYVFNVSDNGSGVAITSAATEPRGIRPVVYLKKTVEFSSGSGSYDDPYKIKGDIENATNNVTLLRSRVSGEYVNFGGESYRIVQVENETTKLIKTDYYIKNNLIITKKFATNYKYGSGISSANREYWDYYLNGIWKVELADDIESMLVKGTYYIKQFAGGNYKGAVCDTVDNTVSIKNCEKLNAATWTGYVGIPRYGELFATVPEDYTSSTAEYSWLITPDNTSLVWRLGNGGYIDANYPYLTRPTRFTIHLNSNVVITSGSGTKQTPFEIKLPS